MRAGILVGLSLLAWASGCGFAVTSAASDAAVDAPPDVPPPMTWTVDATSGKACPASATEWADFIGAKGLGIAVPDGQWSMQEAAGSLQDAIGDVHLMPFGPARYRRNVPGWSRVAASTVSNTASGFYNSASPGLPDLSSSSMLVLMYYRTATAPSTQRSILFGGAGTPNLVAHLAVNSSQRLVFTVGSGTPVTGTVTYGADVVPILLQLDRTSQVQRIITDAEVITAPYKALPPTRGLILGGASSPAPDGDWLCLSAWYSADAEASSPDLTALLAGLGWP